MREKEKKENKREKEIKKKNIKEKRKGEIYEKKIIKIIEGKNNYKYFFYDCADVVVSSIQQCGNMILVLELKIMIFDPGIMFLLKEVYS